MVAGHLTSVVFDRATRAVTHLVVEPRRLGGTGRLVSVALVASTAGDVRLHCTSSEFKALEDAAETTRPVGASDALYGQGTELFGGGGPSGLRGPHNLVVSRIPPDEELEIHGGDPVLATDGDIGEIHALVVLSDHHLTHVLLDEGHRRGHERAAIPLDAVKDLEGGIRLNLTKGEVRAPAPIRPRPPRLAYPATR